MCVYVTLCICTSLLVYVFAYINFRILVTTCSNPIKPDAESISQIKYFVSGQRSVGSVGRKKTRTSNTSNIIECIYRIQCWLWMERPSVTGWCRRTRNNKSSFAMRYVLSRSYAVGMNRIRRGTVVKKRSWGKSKGRSVEREKSGVFHIMGLCHIPWSYVQVSVCCHGCVEESVWTRGGWSWVLSLMSRLISLGGVSTSFFLSNHFTFFHFLSSSALSLTYISFFFNWRFFLSYSH